MRLTVMFAILLAACGSNVSTGPDGGGAQPGAPSGDFLASFSCTPAGVDTLVNFSLAQGALTAPDARLEGTLLFVDGAWRLDFWRAETSPGGALLRHGTVTWTDGGPSATGSVRQGDTTWTCTVTL